MAKNQSSSTAADSDDSVGDSTAEINEQSFSRRTRRFPLIMRDFEIRPGAYAIGGPGHDSTSTMQGPDEEDNEDLPIAFPVQSEEYPEEENDLMRTNFHMEIILLTLSLITIGICTYVFSETSDSPSPSPSPTPSFSPTFSPTISVQPTTSLGPTTVRLQLIKELLIPISGENVLNDPKSIQNWAWNHIGATNSMSISMSQPDKIIQRYVVVVVGMTLLNVKDFELGILHTNTLTECDLFHCNEDGELIDIIIFNNLDFGPFGTIAKEIGHLKSLERIVLRNNLSIGTIPTEIGMLKNLTQLDLGINLLTGPIPTEVGEMKNLEWLILSQNRLQDSIPDEIGNLKNLFFGDFSNNTLHGNIPRSINSMDQLKGLDLHMNDFSGDAEFVCDRNYSGIPYIFNPDTRNKLFYGENMYNLTFQLDVTLDCDDSLICSCCRCI